MTSANSADWKLFFDPGGSDVFDKTTILKNVLKEEELKGNNFFRRSLLSSSKGKALVLDPETNAPVEVLMLGSNSYLGFTYNDRVVNAAVKATKKYGYGTGAVSLYAGTTDLHKKLERKIAEFYACEDAIIFPSGYSANVGVISGLMRARDQIINDIFNHASIFDGCLLSGAKVSTYIHNNMKHLRRVLGKEKPTDGGRLIVTDGVFSMEGDIAKLDELYDIAREHGARLMIDEAHALGVIGSTGRGTAEHYSLQGKIDVTVGTLSKAPGAAGGYVVGTKELCEYLRYYGRSYFFSTSLPTPLVAGLLEVFDILSTDTTLTEKLWQNITFLKDGLSKLGFDTGWSASAIIPLIVRDSEKLKAFLRDLFKERIFVNYVAFPAVPKNRSRARLSVMAQHTLEELEQALSVFEKLGKKHGIID